MACHERRAGASDLPRRIVAFEEEVAAPRLFGKLLRRESHFASVLLAVTAQAGNSDDQRQELEIPPSSHSNSLTIRRYRVNANTSQS